jgi:hypothetical protein
VTASAPTAASLPSLSAGPTRLRVVFFLDGGGACVDAETCAFTGLGTPGEENYDWKVTDDPADEGGIFDFARADNPFGDYSFLYVPSCTGDAHLVDVTREYSPELTVEHNGFVNGTTALDYLAENYPHAAQVVVVGKTVGSVAAPIYGGLAAGPAPRRPGNRVRRPVGPHSRRPRLQRRDPRRPLGRLRQHARLGGQRKADGARLGPHTVLDPSRRLRPEIVLARFDYAYDSSAAEDVESMGRDPSELLAMIDANEAAIEDAGVVLHSYTAAGNGHGIFEWPAFYELEVNGVRLVDWVAALVAGKPVDDVHCDPCGTP